MASVILDNIPHDLLKLLEQKANSHERTLEEEIVQTLQHAVNSDQENRSTLIDALSAFRQEYHEDNEEPYVDPFVDVRDMTPSSQDNPWEN